MKQSKIVVNKYAGVFFFLFKRTTGAGLSLEDALFWITRIRVGPIDDAIADS